MFGAGARRDNLLTFEPIHQVCEPIHQVDKLRRAATTAKVHSGRVDDQTPIRGHEQESMEGYVKMVQKFKFVKLV